MGGKGKFAIGGVDFREQCLANHKTEGNLLFVDHLKPFFKSAVLTLLAVSSGGALAAAQTYHIQAEFDLERTIYDGSLLEAQGWDANSYAQLNHSFGPGVGIGNQLRDWLVPQVAALGHANISLSYDQQAVASASYYINSAFYAGASSPLAVTLSGAGGSQMLSSGVNTLSVYTGIGGRSQLVEITSNHNWFNGPLPENSFALQVPAVPEFSADLKTLFQQAIFYAGSFEDFASMRSMPIRLTAPQTFGVNSVVLSLFGTGPAGTYAGVLPIDLLTATQFEQKLLYISFTAKFDVRVDVSDYANEADFLTAKSWVDANLRQIDYDLQAQFDISTVSAVPEPSSMLLTLLGASVVLGVSCRRRLRLSRPRNGE